MLRWAVKQYDGPVAIRYPRGGEGSYTDSHWQADSSIVNHRQGKDVTLITYGMLINQVMEAADLLSQNGIEASVLRLTELSRWNREELIRHLGDHHTAVVVEEVCSGSGIREAICSQLGENYRIKGIDLGPDFVPHGATGKLYKLCGLDSESIADFTREVLER
jgi:1-deoxy-D-xylulose-5-phosphate synthase